MSTIKRITSRDNAFYKSLHKLASSSRERRTAGQTLLDGPHLLRAFLDAGGKPLHLLLNGQALQNAEIVALLATCADVPQTQLDDALFAQLSELKTPNGLLALIDIPQPKRVCFTQPVRLVAGRPPGPWQPRLHLAQCRSGRLRCGVPVARLCRCVVAQSVACGDGRTFRLAHP